MFPIEAERGCRLQLDLADRVGRDDGVALLVTLMAIAVASTVALALGLVATTETRIAANYAYGTDALYAADGIARRAMLALAATPVWDAALAGIADSGVTDGPASGHRQLPDGSMIDLAAETNIRRCGKPAPCSDEDMNETTADRPWGLNNPRWQIYAWGSIGRWAGLEGARTYGVAWLADDPSETDGDALRDGTEDDNPGRGIVMIQAHGYGAGGARRAVEVTVARRIGAPAQLAVVSWRELR